MAPTWVGPRLFIIRWKIQHEFTYKRLLSQDFERRLWGGAIHLTEKSKTIDHVKIGWRDEVDRVKVR